MKQGIITKGVGGFYDVLVDNYVVRCRARGYSGRIILYLWWAIR